MNLFFMIKESTILSCSWNKIDSTLLFVEWLSGHPLYESMNVSGTEFDVLLILQIEKKLQIDAFLIYVYFNPGTGLFPLLTTKEFSNIKNCLPHCCSHEVFWHFKWIKRKIINDNVITTHRILNFLFWNMNCIIKRGQPLNQLSHSSAHAQSWLSFFFLSLSFIVTLNMMTEKQSEREEKKTNMKLVAV